MGRRVDCGGFEEIAAGSSRGWSPRSSTWNGHQRIIFDYPKFISLREDKKASEVVREIQDLPDAVTYHP